MNRLICLRPILATLLAAALLVPALFARGDAAASGSSILLADGGAVTLKGECIFGSRKGTFTARLTPTGADTYDVVYSVLWGGKTSEWKGTIKSDLKGDIAGTGSTAGDRSFEYSGKFDGGVAKCSYKEVGGRGRNGTLTLTR